MILGGNAIHEAFNSVWTAYRDDAQVDMTSLHVNPNSVDVTLDRRLLRPGLKWPNQYLDPHDPDSLTYTELDCQEGYLLQPGEFVLGKVRERFECFNYYKEHPYVQMYEGRSTCGRIGLASHVTAGFGDYGFSSAFVLEIFSVVKYPIMLRAGMRIGQVQFTQTCEPIMYTGAYTGTRMEPKLGEDRF